MNCLIISDSLERLRWARSLWVKHQPDDNYSIVIIGNSFEKSIDNRFPDAEAFITVKTEKEVFTGIDLNRFSHAIIMTSNYSIRQVFESFQKQRAGKKTPVSISGFENFILESCYDHLVNRFSADIICVIGKSVFRNLDFVGKHSAGYSLPIVVRVDPSNSDANHGPHAQEIVVFETQRLIPSSMEERLYVVEEFIKLARQNPHVNIVFSEEKPEQESSNRVPEVIPYEKIFELLQENAAAPNIHFSNRNRTSLLESAKMLVTFSSAGAADAVLRNIPLQIISDFGLQENLGTHHFALSGCLQKISMLLTAPLHRPLQRWIDESGLHTGKGNNPFSVEI